MNLIVICLDSLRQDHVSFYHQGKPAFSGVAACKTPNIDAFAQECVAFENAYPSNLPTIPIRTELMLGQHLLPSRRWQPLQPTDLPLAELLQREGYTNGLISDVYHYRAPGMNFHRGFHAYRWVRGQEYDPYNSQPTRRNLDDYVNEHYNAYWRKQVAQFLANTDDFTEPQHWFTAQVIEQACQWLVNNRSHQRLFCWIDCFDPHEPWDPPKAFDTYTDPAYTGKRLIMPMGGRADDWVSPDGQRYIRGLYAGEVSLVDASLGPLFACLKKNGYFEDSVILLLGDHGHPLADHGKFLKGSDRMYSELLKVPFLIRTPKQKHRRTAGLVQFPDVAPTLLELMGLAGNSEHMSGKSFASLVRGDTDAHRCAVICGYHEGKDRCYRDETFSYVQRPEGEPDELYNLRQDPRETTNLIDRHPDEAKRLAQSFGNVFRRGPVSHVKGIQGKYEVASGNL